MPKAVLEGVGVLVTRPRQQAEELVMAVRALGGHAVDFPVIEPRPRSEEEISADVAMLAQPDIAIFVSANAARLGLDYAGPAKLAAIGPATASVLEQAGRTVDIRSSRGYNSERLLETPELQSVEGKVVRIIRGDGGRELLAKVLRDRGATVEYLAVYTREVPRYSEAEINAITELWLGGSIDVVTVMSVETLVNLIDLLPRTCREALASTPLVTPATRVIKEAKRRFPGIPTTLANGPQAGEIAEAIVACVKSRTLQ
jgi:uroporphyrinogen-III synthase